MPLARPPPPCTPWQSCKYTKSAPNLHEGGPDPDKMQKMCKATDYALRVTKMMVQAVGQTTSTLVVQECHLWLNVRRRESELS